MKLWRRPRSGGYRVSRSVHRLIVEANAARDAGEWARAATGYAMALRQRPDLHHILIQRGHMLKALGDWAGAEAAYRTAVRLLPEQRDAVLQLGHLQKVSGRMEAAAHSYVSLVLADPGDEEALRETCETLAHLGREVRQKLARSVIGRLGEPDEGASDQGVRLPGGPLVYDVSDLLRYFATARRPSGIQRVQIEVLIHAVGTALAGGRAATVVAFVNETDGWVDVPAAAFLHLARLSLAEGGDDADLWRRSRDSLLLSVLSRDPVTFSPGATLVNLGASWWLRGYLAAVGRARDEYGICYVPLVFDLIPMLSPEYFIDSLVEDYAAWLAELFDRTDAFLAISEATKRDLIAVAAATGRTVRPDRVRVIPLDADFATDASREGTPADLAEGGEYVLLVSTIEPRKGHLVAFDSWSLLIDQLGAARVPRLVCVGHGGWRNAAIVDRLATDDRLRERITMVSGLSDAALRELYEGSIFTVYPSLYEGWGLPVTESLCRGKVVVTTSSSSLPEAGGDFAIYVPPGDAPALAAAIRNLVEQPDMRLALERRIRKEFRPRSWGEIAQQIGDDALALTGSAGRVEHGRPCH